MLPIKSVACMLFFVLNFLDDCTGRIVPSLCTYHYCLRFYGNFPFPRLRMAHDDISPRPKILNIFNLIWTLISQHLN